MIFDIFRYRADHMETPCYTQYYILIFNTRWEFSHLNFGNLFAGVTDCFWKVLIKLL